MSATRLQVPLEPGVHNPKPDDEKRTKSNDWDQTPPNMPGHSRQAHSADFIDLKEDLFQISDHDTELASCICEMEESLRESEDTISQVKQLYDKEKKRTEHLKDEVTVLQKENNELLWSFQRLTSQYETLAMDNKELEPMAGVTDLLSNSIDGSTRSHVELKYQLTHMKGERLNDLNEEGLAKLDVELERAQSKLDTFRDNKVSVYSRKRTSGPKLKPFVEYIIELSIHHSRISFPKQYKDFLNLQKQLRNDEYLRRDVASLPKLPNSVLQTERNPKVIAKRMLALESFMNAILNSHRMSTCQAVADFLDEPFEINRPGFPPPPPSIRLPHPTQSLPPSLRRRNPYVDFGSHMSLTDPVRQKCSSPHMTWPRRQRRDHANSVQSLLPLMMPSTPKHFRSNSDSFLVSGATYTPVKTFDDHHEEDDFIQVSPHKKCELISVKAAIRVLEGRTKKQFVAYDVEVMLGDERKHITKEYRDFLSLHKSLRNHSTFFQRLPKLPNSLLIRSQSNPKVVSARVNALQEFMTFVLNSDLSSSEEISTFLLDNPLRSEISSPMNSPTTSNKLVPTSASSKQSIDHNSEWMLISEAKKDHTDGFSGTFSSPETEGRSPLMSTLENSEREFMRTMHEFKKSPDTMEQKPTLMRRVKSALSPTNHKRKQPLNRVKPRSLSSDNIMSHLAGSPFETSAPPPVLDEGLEFIVPERIGKSHILNDDKFADLLQAIPARHKWDMFVLLYSLEDHGISFQTFLSKTHERGSTLVVVKTTCGRILGGFASASWRPCRTYYGSGETFMFSFNPEFKKYPWAEMNDYYMLTMIGGVGEATFLALGGGDNHALRIDEHFNVGTTGYCQTFDSPPLLGEEKKEFEICAFEVWGFGFDLP